MDFQIHRAENQLRTFETLWAEILPHVRTDTSLPARIQQRLAKEKRFGSRDRRLYRELIYTALRFLPWLENKTPCPPALTTLWLSADTPATTPLKQALLAAFPPCPATIAGRAAILGQQPDALIPAWFRAHCPAAFEPPNIDALHTRAPLWLRLQTDNPAPVFAEFAARGWTWRPPSVAQAAEPAFVTQAAEPPSVAQAAEPPSVAQAAEPAFVTQAAEPASVTQAAEPAGLENGAGTLPTPPTNPQPAPLQTDAIELLAPNDPDITQTDSYKRGLIEIQDLGSQLILPICLRQTLTPIPSPSGRGMAGGRGEGEDANAAQPHIMTCLDACAGAGGKTLQLARILGPAAQIDAADPRSAALAELSARAARAGLKNIRIVSQPASCYDLILVDAPCSGSGTWRRSPHLKYTTTEQTILAAAALQLKILARHAPLVRPDGGLLVYATCSLSRRENEDVIAAFLDAPAHRDFALLHQTTILPAEHDTDGFFTATLRRSKTQ